MDRIHPLRAWRLERRKTLAGLAARVGVTPSHLSEIERGLNQPSMNLAAKLSRATGGEVQVGDFVRQPARASA